MADYHDMVSDLARRLESEPLLEVLMDEGTDAGRAEWLEGVVLNSNLTVSEVPAFVIGVLVGTGDLL